MRETADLLEIGELLDRKPGQLSGGQRQRVAMGRALVRKPQAFLLDEPLSNLDAKLRTQVRGDLKRLHRELPVTSIYVTHDQVEAMTLGDRLCVMSDGEVQQIGTTDDIYNRPANTFVAAFMGSPPMNLIPGDDARRRAARRRHTDRRRGRSPTARSPSESGPSTSQVHARRPTGAVPARVDFCEPLGSHVLVNALVERARRRTARGSSSQASPETLLEPGAPASA